MIIYGVGYNPAFTNKKLLIPECAALMELGIAEYRRTSKKFINKKIDFSLHLARTPITECNKNQDRFIKYLQGECIDPSLKSIGIHLTGKRHHGIGQFGFSSHFIPSLESKKQAIRFIKDIKTSLNLPVWIENASFYSSSVEEILETWEMITSICNESNAKLIIDLSHLLIDAKNNAIDPLILLGAIPWKFLSVSSYVLTFFRTRY